MQDRRILSRRGEDPSSTLFYPAYVSRVSIIFVGLIVLLGGWACWLEWNNGTLLPVPVIAGGIGMGISFLALVRDFRESRIYSALYLLILTFSAHIIVVFSGKGDSPLYSVYFLPIIVSSERYGLLGSALIGGIILICYSALFWGAPSNEIIAELPEELITILFMSFISGYLLERVKLKERARRTAELREQESRALAEVGLLAAEVAHEFRNPLQVLAGSTETLESKGWVSVKGSQLLSDMRTMCRKMNRLASDFLLFGRPRFQRTQVVKLQEILANMVAVYSSRGRVEIPAELPNISRGDCDAIERLFSNLLDNAFQSGATCIRVSSAGETAVRVSDDGAGVTKAAKENLFKPFASRRPGGTGLGLAIVRTIARAHGGDVVFEGNGVDLPGASFLVLWGNEEESVSE